MKVLLKFNSSLKKKQIVQIYKSHRNETTIILKKRKKGSLRHWKRIEWVVFENIEYKLTIEHNFRGLQEEVNMQFLQEIMKCIYLHPVMTCSGK